jgi:hypothetical protein
MNSTEVPKSKDQVLTLDSENSVKILAQFVEVAQQKGAYLLQEAEALKRAMDVVILKTDDKDVSELLAKQLLIQGIQKGQRHGAYSIQDAAVLSKVVQFVIESFPKEQPQEQLSQQLEEQEQLSQQLEEQEHIELSSSTDDLSDLAEPIPLKPKEV